ncbi:YetF domain-containing protein [Arcanobacterium canis]
MKRAHITRTEVLSELRKKGVHSLDEVAAVILERTGDMSLLRVGTLIDPQMIVGVRSAGEIPQELLAQDK